MKKKALFLIFFSLVIISSSHGEGLRIAGPCVMESIPFIISEKSGPDNNFKFKLWHSPDQIRAMIAGGQTDGAIITTYSALVLREKGIKLKIAAVFENPLWIVSDGDYLFHSIEELKGKIFLPFGPGEMPDLILAECLGDFYEKIDKKHTGSAFEAINLIFAKKGSHALLSEPLASAAVSRSLSMGKGSVIVKSMDMKKLWKEKYNGKRLFLSCLAFFGKSLENEEEISVLIKNYKKTLKEMEQNPLKAAEVLEQKYRTDNFLRASFDFSNNSVSIFTKNEAKEDTLFFLDKISKKFHVSEKDDLFVDIK